MNKKKIASYVDEHVKADADALAKRRGMSTSVLIASLLIPAIREAREKGEL